LLPWRILPALATVIPHGGSSRWFLTMVPYGGSLRWFATEVHVGSSRSSRRFGTRVLRRLLRASSLAREARSSHRAKPVPSRSGPIAQRSSRRAGHRPRRRAGACRHDQCRPTERYKRPCRIHRAKGTRNPNLRNAETRTAAGTSEYEPRDSGTPEPARINERRALRAPPFRWQTGMPSSSE
jgi:hypothetical protein